jgi:hypothetical protein
LVVANFLLQGAAGRHFYFYLISQARLGHRFSGKVQRIEVSRA